MLALPCFGYEFAWVSWMMGERSAFSPAGPPLYHCKSVSPIVGVLLTIQGIAEVSRCIMCLRSGEWPARLEDVRETEEALPIHKREEIQETRP